MKHLANILSFTIILCTAGFQKARAVEQAFKQPDLVSFSAGYQNFDRDHPMRRSVDLRAEYRWGLSLFPTHPFDRYFQVHPFVGLEASTFNTAYALAGLSADFFVGKHGVITWGEGAGLYYSGPAMPMGSVLEFRSSAEVGYIFDNQIRVSAFISHTSNAKITNQNPGVETIGLYLHVPFETLTSVE